MTDNNTLFQSALILDRKYIIEICKNTAPSGISNSDSQPSPRKNNEAENEDLQKMFTALEEELKEIRSRTANYQDNQHEYLKESFLYAFRLLRKTKSSLSFNRMR